MAESKKPDKDKDKSEAESKGTEKKFFRDGARYVCTICKQKFFTRIEVEKCHDGH